MLRARFMYFINYLNTLEQLKKEAAVDMAVTFIEC